MTREPYSLEAEQGLLGAMMIRPELIDVLAADVRPDDFFFEYNRAVFKAIMDLQAANKLVDFLTIADQIGELPNGDSALAYCAEVHRNTPSAANAKEYARIVLERSTDRALMAAATAVHELAESDASTEDKIAQAHAEIMAINSATSTSETITACEAVDRHVQELERRERLGGRIDGLETGIESLDAKLLGLKPGQLVVIAGRPKMGKTTLAMNIADNAAVKHGKQVLVYSLEMSVSQLVDKSLSSLGMIPYQALRDGTATTSHGTQLGKTASKIKASGLTLYDRRGATINRIRASARRHKLRHGLDLVVVDHIGLVDVDDARASAVQRVSEVTRQLKLLAQELGVPVLAMSQLNRQLEQRPNKRPIPSDLRDSGSIEQDADTIVFVYRDEVYNENTADRGVAEIIIGVARDIEPCTVRVRYQGMFSLFSDLGGYQPPAPARYPAANLLD